MPNKATRIWEQRRLGVDSMQRAIAANMAALPVNAALLGADPSRSAEDNRVALQSAIAIAQIGKRPIQLKASETSATYRISSTLFIGVEGQRYACDVIGESWNGDIAQTNQGGVTLTLADGANCDLFRVASTAAPCRFENLNLQGNKANQTGIVQGGEDRSYGVYFVDYTTNANKQRSGHFYNCRIESFASGGVRVGLLRNAGSLNHCTILNCGRTFTGTAQGGGASTITLSSSASASDDAYNGMGLVIASGTGKGQKRTISDYVGSTKVATTSVAWEVQPDNTSVFIVDLTLADGLLFGSCNDWRVTDCDIGTNTRNGIYSTGAGSITFKNTATFTNHQNGIQCDSTGMDLTYLGGSIDTNYECGAWLRGSSANPDQNFAKNFVGVRFNQNGLGAHNTYADVRLTNEHGASIVGCYFIRGSAAATNGRFVKHLVEFLGTSEKCVWSGNIYVVPGSDAFETGTAQAGAAGTITLATGASATTDFYKDTLVTITGGTGSGQQRVISAYNGSAKVATVSVNFSPAPDATSTYKISPQPCWATSKASDPFKLISDGSQRQGEYTPASAGMAVTNVQGVTFGLSMYFMVGEFCYVAGTATLDPTADAAQTVFGIPLPIPSDFTLTSDCRGTINSGAVVSQGVVNADTATNRANVTLISSGTAAQPYTFQFMYRVR